MIGLVFLSAKASCPKNPPAVLSGSLDNILPKYVIDRPGTALRLDGIDRWAGDDDLPDSIEWRVFFCRYGTPKRMLSSLTEVFRRKVDAGRECYTVREQIRYARVG